jgi:threonine dehydrogenase-like Zn-dependent dehydrogenase
LIAQTLALTGCNLQVAARYPQQRALLARRGIPSIQPEQIPLASMDVVVEATGSAQGFDLARRAVRPRGVIVLKSTYRGDVPVNLSHIVVNEVTIVGSRCGPFPKALQLLASGQVDPLPLIDSQYPLSAGLSAFERAAQPGVLKVLIAPR